MSHKGSIGKGCRKKGLNLWYGRDFLAPTPSVRQPLFETSESKIVLHYRNAWRSRRTARAPRRSQEPPKPSLNPLSPRSGLQRLGGQGVSVKSTMCKWTRPFGATDCQRPPKGLSSALCSAGIERARKCVQGEHFVRDAVTVPTVCFSGFSGAARAGSAAVCDPNPSRPVLGIDKRGVKMRLRF